MRLLLQKNEFDDFNFVVIILKMEGVQTGIEGAIFHDGWYNISIVYRNGVYIASRYGQSYDFEQRKLPIDASYYDSIRCNVRNDHDKSDFMYSSGQRGGYYSIYVRVHDDDWMCCSIPRDDLYLDPIPIPSIFIWNKLYTDHDFVLGIQLARQSSNTVINADLLPLDLDVIHQIKNIVLQLCFNNRTPKWYEIYIRHRDDGFMS